MRAADNGMGWVVERHDGPKVGWVAIDGPFAKPEHAHIALDEMARTPGAEYRIYQSLALPEKPQVFDFKTVHIALAQYAVLMQRLFAMGGAQE